MKKLWVGDSVKFKDGRNGIVVDYDEKNYYVKDDNGNIVKIRKINDLEKYKMEKLPLEDLREELKTAIKEYYKKAYAEYLDLIPSWSVRTEEEDNGYKVTVGVEDDYDELEKLCDLLDPIIAKYDKNAYFEPEDAGLISAWISKNNVKDSEDSKKVKDNTEKKPTGYRVNWISTENQEVINYTDYEELWQAERAIKYWRADDAHDRDIYPEIEELYSFGDSKKIKDADLEADKVLTEFVEQIVGQINSSVSFGKYMLTENKIDFSEFNFDITLSDGYEVYDRAKDGATIKKDGINAYIIKVEAYDIDRKSFWILALDEDGGYNRDEVLATKVINFTVNATVER